MRVPFFHEASVVFDRVSAEASMSNVPRPSLSFPVAIAVRQQPEQAIDAPTAMEAGS